MWPGQTVCDAMTALRSMEMHALVFECVRVCVYSLFICPQRGDRELWCMLYKNYWLQPQISAHRLSATLSQWLFPWWFFFLFAVVQFNTGMKSLFFFSFTALWHPESFSFCSLGEAANALDETLTSFSFHLIVWRVNLISLPSCVRCIFGGKKSSLKIKAVLMKLKTCF